MDLFAAVGDLARVHVSLETKAARPLIWEDFLESNEVRAQDVIAERHLAQPLSIIRAPETITTEIPRDDSDVSQDAEQLTQRTRAATQIAMGVILVIFGVLLALLVRVS